MLPTYVSLRMINIALLTTVLTGEARSQTNDFILQLQGLVCLYFKHTSYLSFFMPTHVKAWKVHKVAAKKGLLIKEQKITFSKFLIQDDVFGIRDNELFLLIFTFVGILTNMSNDSKWSLYSQLSAFSNVHLFWIASLL